MFEGRFSNVDAIICWVVTIVELIGVITYIVVQHRGFRRKMVAMGRLIPSFEMIAASTGYQPVTHVVVAQPLPPPGPPQPGFQQPQPYDYPPAYSTVTTNQYQK